MRPLQHDQRTAATCRQSQNPGGVAHVLCGRGSVGFGVSSRCGDMEFEWREARESREKVVNVGNRARSYDTGVDRLFKKDLVGRGRNEAPSWCTYTTDQ